MHVFSRIAGCACLQKADAWEFEVRSHFSYPAKCYDYDRIRISIKFCNYNIIINKCYMQSISY